MIKTFKEYIGVSRGYAFGPVSINKPMASMGGSQFYPQHRRYSTVYASYSGAGHGTFNPITSLNANKQLPPHLSKFFDKDGNIKDKNVQKKIEKHFKSKNIKYKITDVTPKGYGPKEDLIHGLGFRDSKRAEEGVSKIEESEKNHTHKMQAALSMGHRAKIASQRAINLGKKKKLTDAYKVYENYINENFFRKNR